DPLISHFIGCESSVPPIYIGPVHLVRHLHASKLGLYLRPPESLKVVHGQSTECRDCEHCNEHGCIAIACWASLHRELPLSEWLKCQPSAHRLPIRRKSALGDRRFLEGCSYPFGKLQRIVIRPEMHEEHSRLFREHVAVDCRHLDAVLAQGPDQRVDL